jgi:photosystem II stability/assembly factor-like uncharacterized protein
MWGVMAEGVAVAIMKSSVLGLVTKSNKEGREMASILYLGTDHGVMTLRNEGGGSWKVEHDGLKEWSVSEVAVVPSTPNRVLAGTRGDGVWFSEDFGKSWKKPCYGKRGPGKVRCIAFDPKDPALTYAGTEPIDLFVSDDLGKSWERLGSVWDVPWVGTVDYPVKTVEPHVRDIAVDPNDPKKIYIALQVGYMLKSTDGGASWKLLNNELDADVHTIVINPLNPDNLFIATGGHDCRKGTVRGRALYKSQDAGESWTPLALDFSQEYSVPLTMHPQNPNVLYAALANGQPSQWRRPTGAESVVVRSKDGGENWEKLEKGLSDVDRDFADSIVLDETSPECLYAAFRSGRICASEDRGDSWVNLDVNVSSVSDMKCVHA